MSSRDHYKQIAINTLNYCDKHHEPNNSVFINLNNNPLAHNLSRPLKDAVSKFEIVNQDTIEAALQGIENGDYENPLLMNMASEFQPGGGWKKGSMAQEEALFLRTNYCKHLKKRKGSMPRERYIEDHEMVYSPRVRVIKNKNYSLIPEDRQPVLSFIACPGIRRPELDSKGRMCERDRDIVTRRLHHVFQIAQRYGHDAVILGALGCGAFKNPPEDIAECYRDVIPHYKNGIFKCIKFAILSIRDRNYEIFRGALSRRWFNDLPVVVEENKFDDLDIEDY